MSSETEVLNTVLPLTEVARRKPGFTEGVAIQLCNGESWTFPLPTTGDFYFTRGDDGRTKMARGSSFGDAYDALLDRYVETEDGVAEATALADIAFELLSRNYDVSFNECRALLRRVPVSAEGHEANQEMWSAIGNVAVGKSGK